MFRVVSESCQINFVRCYANCPDPGDVLILIIEATLRYGVSVRSSNLEICFLSLWSALHFPAFVLLLSGPHILLHLAGCVICLTLNVIWKITRLRSLPFGVWKLCLGKLSDWKHQRGLWMQNTTRRFIIYIRDSAISKVYSIILRYSRRSCSISVCNVNFLKVLDTFKSCIESSQRSEL